MIRFLSIFPRYFLCLASAFFLNTLFILQEALPSLDFSVKSLQFIFVNSLYVSPALFFLALFFFFSSHSKKDDRIRFFVSVVLNFILISCYVLFVYRNESFTEAFRQYNSLDFSNNPFIAVYWGMNDCFFHPLNTLLQKNNPIFIYLFTFATAVSFSTVLAFSRLTVWIIADFAVLITLLYGCFHINWNQVLSILLFKKIETAPQYWSSLFFYSILILMLLFTLKILFRKELKDDA